MESNLEAEQSKQTDPRSFQIIKHSLQFISISIFLKTLLLCFQHSLTFISLIPTKLPCQISKSTFQTPVNRGIKCGSSHQTLLSLCPVSQFFSYWTFCNSCHFHNSAHRASTEMPAFEVLLGQFLAQ